MRILLISLLLVGCKDSRREDLEPRTPKDAAVIDAAVIDAPLAMIDAPAAMIDAPTVIIDAPVAMVDAPTVMVDAPTVMVDAPTVMVDAPTVMIDAPTVMIDAPIVMIDAPAPVDAPTGSIVVSCYSQGNPANTCTAPSTCCFDNYTAQHNGFCSQSTCTWGTIRCDGPEDCSGGQRCCATAQRDPDLGTTGYNLACKTGPCGGPQLDFELCHPGPNTCATGSCISALGVANDLPRSLHVCQ